MKILKGIFLGIVALIALTLIVALFVQREYAIERQITINKPVSQVFEYIKHLRNQDNFSVWATRDPHMKKAFRGTDGTVGFVSAWDSENKEVGKGEQEITKIAENKRVDFELRFSEPFEATDYAYMTTDSVDVNQTNVKWGFNGKMNYPMNIMMLFIDMDEMLGKDLQTGLNKLKSNFEQQ